MSTLWALLVWASKTFVYKVITTGGVYCPAFDIIIRNNYCIFEIQIIQTAFLWNVFISCSPLWDAVGSTKINIIIGTKPLIVTTNRSMGILQKRDSHVKEIFSMVLDFWCHNITWNCPPPSNSHHQDYETFFVGNPNLNLHLWVLLGGG